MIHNRRERGDWGGRKGRKKKERKKEGREEGISAQVHKEFLNNYIPFDWLQPLLERKGNKFKPIISSIPIKLLLARSSVNLLQ